MAGELRYPAVGEQDGAIRGQRQRTVAHAFDQHPIGFVGALQHDDLRSIRPLDDDGIDGAVVDRLDGLFSFAR